MPIDKCIKSIIKTNKQIVELARDGDIWTDVGILLALVAVIVTETVIVSHYIHTCCEESTMMVITSVIALTVTCAIQTAYAIVLIQNCTSDHDN